MKIIPCTPESLCAPLYEFVEPDDTKQGFILLRRVEGGKIVTKGVAYRPKGKDKKPFLLNRCPFCEADLRLFGDGE